MHGSAVSALACFGAISDVDSRLVRGGQVGGRATFVEIGSRLSQAGMGGGAGGRQPSAGMAGFAGFAWATPLVLLGARAGKELGCFSWPCAVPPAQANHAQHRKRAQGGKDAGFRPRNTLYERDGEKVVSVARGRV